MRPSPYAPGSERPARAPSARTGRRGLLQHEVLAAGLADEPGNERCGPAFRRAAPSCGTFVEPVKCVRDRVSKQTSRRAFRGRDRCDPVGQAAAQELHQKGARRLLLGRPNAGVADYLVPVGVACDRGEVDRRDGEHETFERAVVQLFHGPDGCRSFVREVGVDETLKRQSLSSHAARLGLEPSRLPSIVDPVDRVAPRPAAVLRGGLRLQPALTHRFPRRFASSAARSGGYRSTGVRDARNGYLWSCGARTSNVCDVPTERREKQALRLVPCEAPGRSLRLAFSPSRTVGRFGSLSGGGASRRLWAPLIPPLGLRLGSRA